MTEDFYVPIKKMPLKTFVEEYKAILQRCSPDDLKTILINMANEVKPHEREDFIKNLDPTHTPQPQDIPDILEEIDSLKEDIIEQGKEEPDWECDDEDSLAGYEKFLPKLSELFDKVEGLFEQGHYEIAQKSYKELFSIFGIADDYGRRIHIYDVEGTDLEEARARYFRSVYMASQEEKVSLLLKAMEEMADEDFYNRPTLRDLINISSFSLPGFTHFLHQWIETTKIDEKPSHDAWLREATFLLQGSSGLESLAKREGHKRPRVFVDWMNSLIDAKNYIEALNAGKAALSCLTEQHPICATIGDLIVLCGEYLKDDNIRQDGRWISFKAKPDLSKLIALYETSQSSNIISLMQKSTEVIETYRKTPRTQNYEKRWERDEIEISSNPNTTLLLHAILFSGDIEKAFALVKKGETWGESFGDNTQHFFIAYCLIRATKCSLDQAPVHLKKLCETSLNSRQDFVWHDEEDKNEISQKLEDIYAVIFDKPCSIDQKILEWCLETAQNQIEDIVIHQHRKSYDKAVLLTAACTDALTIINPSEATNFFWKIQNKFPRHSSFQEKLGIINIVK